MSVILTSVARVKDWKALHQLHDETFVGRARAAGAIRFQVFRNVYDASQMLIIAEFPDHDAMQEMWAAMSAEQGVLPEGGVLDEQIWEPTAWVGIG